MNTLKKTTLVLIVVFSLFYIKIAFAYTNQWESVTPADAGGDIFNTIVSAGDYIFLGTNTGVYKSSDKGVNWTKINTGLTNTNVNSIAIAWVYNSSNSTYEVTTNTPVFVGTANGIFMGTIGGSSWTAKNSGLSNTNIKDIEIDQAQATAGSVTNLYVATPSGVFGSSDLGDSWTLRNTNFGGGDTNIVKLTSDFGSAKILALTSTNKLYSSALKSASAQDESWSQIFYSSGTTTNDVSVLNPMGNINWIATDKGILKSDENGIDHLSKNIGLGSLNVLMVSSDYSFAPIAYAAVSGTGVYRTENEANTMGVSTSTEWVPINKNLSDLNIKEVKTNPLNSNLVYAMSASGVYLLNLTSVMNPVVDLTPPGTISNLSISDIFDTDVTLTWTAPGSDGAYNYDFFAQYSVRYSTSPINNSNFDSADALVPTTRVNYPGDIEYYYAHNIPCSATYYFAIKATDGSANTSALSNVINTVDTTAPGISSFTISTTNGSLVATINTFTANDCMGVTGYLINESASAPTSNDAGWSGSLPSTYTFSTPGNKILYAWTKDAAGNVSASESRSVSVTDVIPSDSTAPVITFTIPATSNSLTVNFSSFSATDAVGVIGYLVNESASTPALNASGWSGSAQTSYTFSGYGSKTLYAWAKDAAGNVSSAVSRNITVSSASDVTAPVVTAFTIPSTGSSLIMSVSSFTATDATGVTGYMITESSSVPTAGQSGWSISAPTTYTFSSYGSKTLYAWAKDAAGNVSSSLNASITLTAPPVVVTPPVVRRSGGGGGGGGGAKKVATTTPTLTAAALSSFSTPVISTTLKKNDSNESVRSLQKILNSSGFPVANSGIGSRGNEGTFFGPATEKALLSFQTKLGLPVTGIADEKTRTYLNIFAMFAVPSSPAPVTYTPTKPVYTGAYTTPAYTPVTSSSKFSTNLSLGMNHPDVKKLQAFLNNNGFPVAYSGNGSKGQESTYFGPATQKALISFQNYYKSEILTPFGLNQGTGYFGAGTIKKVNSLIK